jgi:hypothetical protein
MADVEPGARERYLQVMEMVIGIQLSGTPTTMHGIPRSDPAWYTWANFCLKILDWLRFKAHYDDYVSVSNEPWPHRYVMLDMVQAFVMIGMFFPSQSDVTGIIHAGYLKATGKDKSALFDQAGRAATLPDRRGGVKPDWKLYGQEGDTSFSETQFEDEAARLTTARQLVEKSNLVTRPILAKLYSAGIINPAYCQPDMQVVGAHAMAGEETGRPGKPDLFLTYPEERVTMPPTFVDHDEWPDLLAEARNFAATSSSFTTDRAGDGDKSESSGPRFALLRLWSAPHFYPLMIGYQNQRNSAFVDGVGRAWQWKFIAKDQRFSEWSIHNVVGMRLRSLLERVDERLAYPEKTKNGKQGRRKSAAAAGAEKTEGETPPEFVVKHRGDLILVGARSERELLKMATAVTFALQTKPWLREVDLWRSFVNVDLAFIEGLDPVWIT